MSLETEESVVPAGRRRQRRQYKCWHCSKVFKRSEHCVRHERIHTQEKPFSCAYCHKSYSRKDLVTRHERTIHAESQPGRNGPRDNVTGGDASTEDSRSQDRVSDSRSPASPVQYPLAAGDHAATMQTFVDCTSFSSLLGNDSISECPLVPSPENTSQDVAEIPSLDHSSEQVPRNDFDNTDHRVHLPSITALEDSFAVPERDTSFLTEHGIDIPMSGQGHQLGTIHHRAPSSLYSMQDIHDQVEVDHILTTESLQLPHADITGFFFSPITNDHFNMSPFSSTLQTGHHQRANGHDGNYSMIGNFQQPGADQRFLHADLGPCGTASNASRDFKHQEDIPFLIEMEQRPPNEPLTLEQSFQASACEALKECLHGEDTIHEIPPSKACQAFLSSYVELFQCHLPIIHLPSVTSSSNSYPLILAMCSIGALYRLDRRRARALYNISRRAIQRDHYSALLGNEAQALEAAPLWVVQTMLLLTFHAAMSDDRALVSSAMEDTGFYSLIYRRAKAFLAEANNDGTNVTWADWIRKESWKRTLGGIYIVTTLMMTVYDINPIFNATSDLDIETFHDESLWNAKTSQEWQEIRRDAPKPHKRKIRNIMLDIISGNREESGSKRYHISPFSALLVMHGVATHMWQRLQLLDAVEPDISTLKRSQESGVARFLDRALFCLSKCQHILIKSRDDKAQDSEDLTESPLTYNCQAIVRIAYMRLFNATGSFNRLCLLSMDPATIETSTSIFATSHLERSPQMLNIVRQSFSGLRIPLKIGHMLVRKTAAFRMGVEHAVAAWDAALFVTKWVHSVETDELRGVRPSAEEEGLINDMKDLLEEADFDPKESKSFAAGIARFWALFLEDVWVWAVTPRMAMVLEKLATAYERINERSHRLFRESLV